MDYLLDNSFTAFLIFIGAVLYSSVGHGGASAYIAILSLTGTPVGIIKPIGLILNIVVSSVASFRFIRHKLFSINVLIPVIFGSIPAAFVGGYISLPSEFYKPLVGIILIIAGLQLLFRFFKKIKKSNNEQISILLAVFIGVLIGLLSGLTGTGGGIFLSPLIIFLGWTSIKGASGTAAVFIFFNSVSGLMGNITSVNSVPEEIYIYIFAVLVGTLIGTHLGIKRFNHLAVKKALGVVIIIAGLKFIIT
ncbi:MAG: sulfite exporter TauE/SafE family protein [Nitrosomonadales bacterium]|nr:sulfite exporter TauE/SafE family protein [Nitrosomonadales bacterium]MBT3918496.1 sulfite exporter TauE/SafE family protein [Nitrosomonadales bacterium]MBT4182494.1 sulfite exporter TauE/SafE family protein [Nitrosomonadales bacterium]MBT6015411.1 sulfite exporter TauE/SafE family protein [Nitrosomonadales bacterium]MBT6602380.1 sulfite exporter TauE/SafE family protein [Nitrosomonadales bacterium]